jgi:hypothetical protein
VFPHSSSTLVHSTLTNQVSGEPETAVEARVRELLIELEQAPPEVQVAVCNRLLIALASKLTPALATKVVSAASAEPAAMGPKAPGAKGNAPRATKSTNYPRPESQLRQLEDATDPVLAWQHFDRSSDALRAVLIQEPLGTLEAMLRHDHMPSGPKPKGKSRGALADTIVDRLERHFAAR